MAYQRSPMVTFEVVEGAAVLLDAEGREVITLNEIGTLVWLALDGAADTNAIAKGMVEEFEGVTLEQLVTDVDAFLDELVGLNLITVEGEPAGD